MKRPCVSLGLGEHTNEVLAEYVADALEIDRLRSTGVIG